MTGKKMFLSNTKKRMSEQVWWMLFYFILSYPHFSGDKKMKHS